MIPIFPQGGLDASVVTTVWVGVWVLCLLNLRFGWTLSGLVVPGYLVPLFMLRPWTASVVLGEAFVTYFLARIVSDYPGRFRLWSSFFGRDRMVLILIVAVVVRLLFDVWLLPQLGAYVTEQLGISFDYRNNLHSFGLVIVALIANQLWKPGLWRGLIPLGVTLGATYLIVRFVLLTWTNFSIGNLGYMYDDIATSMLASPKSYVVLLVTAIWASRMNLVYGWDFSGVLIPALLALQWYQPGKILTSFVEAWVILGLAILALRTPLLQAVTVERARKLLLFFNISFLYKLVVGFLILRFAPDLRVTDAYGFGYLLPTLMAIRMHDKQFGLLFTRWTVQTSLVGVTLASFIGFTLTFLPNPWWGADTHADPLTRPSLHRSRHASVTAALDAEKVRLYLTRARPTFATPLEAELEQLSAGLAALDESARAATLDDDRLDQAVALLDGVGFRVELVEARYLLVTEPEPSRGWGLVLIDTTRSSGLTVEVPAPLDESGTLDAGRSLFAQMGGRVLLVAGAARSTNRTGAADVLRNRQTAYHVAHRVLARRDVLQIRASLDGMDSGLWVRGSLPASLDLPRLEALMGRYAIRFAERPAANAQRAETSQRFAELVGTPSQLRQLTSASSDQMPERVRVSQRIGGYLQEWLREADTIADRGSDTYVPPTLGELMFFDQDVLIPLLELLNTEANPAASPHWSAICAAADFVGYRIIHYQQESPPQSFFILAETARPVSRHRGTYVFRAGSTSPLFLQVPRPKLESRTLEFGIALFEQMDARALFIAGAHPFANRDGSADVVASGNKRSLFSLASQAMVREAAGEARTAVQIRAVRQSTDQSRPTADLLVALGDGKTAPGRLSPLDAALLAQLDELDLTVDLVDGSSHTAGYEAERAFQSRYVDTARNTSFAAVWLTASSGTSYATVQRSRSERTKFAALGVDTVVGTVRGAVAAARPSTRRSPWADELQQTLIPFFSSRDMLLIARITHQWPTVRLERLFDRDLQQSFLLVYLENGRLALVANLLPRQPDQSLTLQPGNPDALDRFLAARAAFLHLEPAS